MTLHHSRCLQSQDIVQIIGIPLLVLHTGQPPPPLDVAVAVEVEGVEERTGPGHFHVAAMQTVTV